MTEIHRNKRLGYSSYKIRISSSVRQLSVPGSAVWGLKTRHGPTQQSHDYRCRTHSGPRYLWGRTSQFTAAELNLITYIYQNGISTVCSIDLKTNSVACFLRKGFPNQAGAGKYTCYRLYTHNLILGLKRALRSAKVKCWTVKIQLFQTNGLLNNIL